MPLFDDAIENGELPCVEIGTATMEGITKRYLYYRAEDEKNDFWVVKIKRSLLGRRYVSGILQDMKSGSDIFSKILETNQQ